jgi:phosphoglucosamine mutase
MSRNYFGTDGIRGRANEHPITAEVALALAQAAGSRFHRGDKHASVVIGKDTRLSGYMLENALTSGFMAMGMDAILLGPLPTPAVALLTRSLRADLGVMISASHNPASDNGIKLFGPDGFKLSDEIESAIEADIQSYLNNKTHPPRVDAPDLGKASRLNDAAGRYVEAVKQTFPRDLSLSGIKIVVDCANGAAYKVAPQILFELGAEVIVLANAPDGHNINANCGATAPGNLSQAVIIHNADIGIALDGDADRLIVVDEQGQVVDGDQIMALIATQWSKLGQLVDNTLVATVMSNLGMERFLESQGIRVARTAVGDRYVVENMRARGFNLGGEQSGHIILSDFGTTGDGLVAAVQVLRLRAETGKPTSDLTSVFTPLPQMLKNVRFKGPSPLDNQSVQNLIADCENRLGSSGRILIRKSGTEPLIRVMAEGEDRRQIDVITDEICAAIKANTAQEIK